MTVPTTIDAAGWLGKYLEGEDGDTDLARAMLAAFVEVLMSAQAPTEAIRQIGNTFAKTVASTSIPATSQIFSTSALAISRQMTESIGQNFASTEAMRQVATRLQTS